MQAVKKTHNQMSDLRGVLMMSAWGFAIVITSFLFLYAGHMLDGILETSPNFTFGLFFLALFTSIGRLYQEAWRKRKNY
jgi:hypothetical protein